MSSSSQRTPAAGRFRFLADSGSRKAVERSQRRQRRTKRSQSKPLRLSPFDSARCMGFLEIEAIGAIWPPFKELQRNRGRFSGAKDRHAPGFISRLARGRPSLKANLECPLDSIGTPTEALPRTRIRWNPLRTHGEPPTWLCRPVGSRPEAFRVKRGSKAGMSLYFIRIADEGYVAHQDWPCP
jgi:hypothetical protein